MSSKYHYYRSISTIVTHALLHLYSEMSKKKQFYPIPKRNEILTKWLKPRMALAAFKGCKKEIKAAIQIGKGKGSIEFALLRLNETNEQYRNNFKEADELYILLLTLYEQHGIASMTTSKELDAEDDSVIYMTEQEKAEGFDGSFTQIKPLKAWIKGVDFSLLSNLVESISTAHNLVLIERLDDVAVFYIDRKERGYANQ